MKKNAIREPQTMSPDKKAAIFRAMQSLWSRLPQSSNTTKIIEEDRNR